MRDFFQTMGIWFLIVAGILWYAEYKGIHTFCLQDSKTCTQQCLDAPWADQEKLDKVRKPVF